MQIPFYEIIDFSINGDVKSCEEEKKKSDQNANTILFLMENNVNKSCVDQKAFSVAQYW